MKSASWRRQIAGLAFAAALIPAPALMGLALAQDAASRVLPPDASVFLESVKKHKDVAEATLDTSHKDYPFIRVKNKTGDTFFLNFEDCDESFKDCYDLWVTASWDRTDVDLSRLNEWNRSALSYAYLDSSGKPLLSHYVVLDGGLVEENLQAIVTNFVTEIGTFARSAFPARAQQN